MNIEREFANRVGWFAFLQIRGQGSVDRCTIQELTREHFPNLTNPQVADITSCLVNRIRLEPNPSMLGIYDLALEVLRIPSQQQSQPSVIPITVVQSSNDLPFGVLHTTPSSQQPRPSQPSPLAEQPSLTPFPVLFPPLSSPLPSSASSSMRIPTPSPFMTTLQPLMPSSQPQQPLPMSSSSTVASSISAPMSNAPSSPLINIYNPDIATFYTIISRKTYNQLCDRFCALDQNIRSNPTVEAVHGVISSVFEGNATTQQISCQIRNLFPTIGDSFAQQPSYTEMNFLNRCTTSQLGGAVVDIIKMIVNARVLRVGGRFF